MGTINLQWVTVHCPSYARVDIEAAQTHAFGCFAESRGCIGSIQHTPVNGHLWFTIGPTGSKLGWHEDDQHKAGIAAFTAWLAAYRRDSGLDNGHGYNPLHWVVMEHDEEEDAFAILDEGVKHDRGDL